MTAKQSNANVGVQARKKILYVITKSNFGGAQRYVYDLATNLPKERFDVTVAFGGTGKPGEPTGRLDALLTAAGIRTIHIPELGRDISMLKDFASLRALIRLFRSEKPDAIHLNSSKAGGLGSLAGRIAGVPRIVFTAHGWPFWEPRNWLARTLIWIASWSTVLLSHRTIVISDFDLRIAQRMPFCRRKLVRIYNGIAPMQLGSGEVIRGAFPPGVKITGTIGELTTNKNHIALIERAHKEPDAHMAIVGEGELRVMLEKKIAEYGVQNRVKLFGFVPAAEVLRGFDVFALPSLKEGLPYVLLEAKTAGLPIEANRIGGIGELLDKPLSEFTLEKMVRATIVQY